MCRCHVNGLRIAGVLGWLACLLLWSTPVLARIASDVGVPATRSAVLMSEEAIGRFVLEECLVNIAAESRFALTLAADNQTRGGYGYRRIADDERRSVERDRKVADNYRRSVDGYRKLADELRQKVDGDPPSAENQKRDGNESK